MLLTSVASVVSELLDAAAVGAFHSRVSSEVGSFEADEGSLSWKSVAGFKLGPVEASLP